MTLEMAELGECLRKRQLEINQLREELKLARAALTEIASADGESLWMDDRDDAADSMLQTAKEALEKMTIKL